MNEAQPSESIGRIPGDLIMLRLSLLSVLYRHFPLINAVFFGVKAAVLAVAVEAGLHISRRALRNQAMVTITIAAFVGIYAMKIRRNGVSR